MAISGTTNGGFTVDWGAYAKLQRLTDEQLIEAIDELNPALLSPQDLRRLRTQLDPSVVPSTGRPKGDVLPRRKLAATITDIHRSDFTPALKKQLLRRLESGRRWTSNMALERFVRSLRRSTQTSDLKYLYRQILPQLQQGVTLVTCQVYDIRAGAVVAKSFALPADWCNFPHNEAALRLAAQIGRDHLGLNPPTLATMRNFVAKKPSYLS